MYFQIENTPERVRKARKMSHNPKEETPRLILAPFSKPPQVVFDDVPVGSSCEKSFEIYNPLKQLQQITLGKDLPPGLNMPLPGEWLELEPETCYCLTIQWTPIQPTAKRETIRFTDKNRGRFDVIVVLKTVLNVKERKTQSKGFKTPLGKKKIKLSKKSPVAIFKKKSEVDNTVKVNKSINVVPSPHQVNFSMDECQKRCPFDCPSNIDFNILEIFSNVTKTDVMQETYDKSKNIHKNVLDVPQDILMPSNNQNCLRPLKTFPITKIDKLDEVRKINVNSNTDFNDDLDSMTFDKENQTHSIIPTVLPMIQPKSQIMEMSIIKNNQPVTSSPKELGTPNFSIDADVSGISDVSFFPQIIPKINETQELVDNRLNSDTYTKGSPLNPVEGNNCHMNMEKPPHYFDKDQPKMCRQSFDAKCPLRSLPPPLKSISEESIQLSNTQVFDKTSKHSATFTINRTFGNFYTQSSTVNPFTSSTHFYDKDAVHKFENEFKKWLNCILTPPADLDSDVEQKIDVGKAWLENRNKEVLLVPTKEQVSSTYHNSQRLESLRRSARNLLLSPDIVQVFQNLNVQIESKLIAIRVDRNLHLDIVLQKTIMGLLLSYNPLWLRIGLEAIYGVVLPLKSNSDIEGLTTFVIQRMFKNPFLKNKNSKSSSTNKLLPQYMEAIKKYTMKKFFMLVFFLDQAKQRKLIAHDPCLFCRNAICKESTEILIRFTREVIAGIGDITKHLRPLGYIVRHKQSYLDEYKYAVHNLAMDIRDGVRLTKLMEIILMKKGLVDQLRTPAISRLQKIHNVQVAMNALKEANFVINGDITPTDIADGHREKTLSLLWQIIHVFRAPLFEKAANVIQIWWTKKNEIIVEKRKEEQITRATITVQKYCRMWLCKTRLQRYKTSVKKIEDWYKAQSLMKQERLKYLKIQKASVIIQRFYRAYILGTKTRHAYLSLKNSTIIIQRRYKALLAMKRDRSSYISWRAAAITIQRRYRAQILMLTHRRQYLKTLEACKTIQQAYRAHILCKRQRTDYLRLRRSAILIQTRFRMLIETRKVHNHYKQLRSTAILIQRRFRANQLTLTIRKNEAAKKIQTWYKSIRQRDTCRKEFLVTLKRVTTVQALIRMYLVRKKFVKLKAATLTIQRYYRSYRSMLQQRKGFLHVRQLIIMLQSCVRSCILRKRYLRLQAAVSNIQMAQKLKRQRDLLRARKENAATVLQKYARRYLVQSWFKRYRQKVLYVQEIWKGKLLTRLLRSEYLQKKKNVIKLQSLARGYLVRKKVQINKQYTLQMQEEQRQNRAASKIQALFRGHQARKQNNDDRVTTLRRRWREGALHSTEPTLKERNNEALALLGNSRNIRNVIYTFQALEYLSEAMPTFYDLNASTIVNHLFVCMMVVNRSISSIQLLTSGAAILVNLARYKVTGPQIYDKQYIVNIMKWMLRFASSETLLFCKLATYLWLGFKYDGVREQLQELLHTQENHKTMIRIKSNVDRIKRMANTKNTSQPRKSNSNLKRTCGSTYVMPALEPDYGLVRVDNPRYFQDPQQAIDCLFHTYNL